MERIVCQSCGSNELRLEGGVLECMYCGAKYILSEHELKCLRSDQAIDLKRRTYSDEDAICVVTGKGSFRIWIDGFRLTDPVEDDPDQKYVNLLCVIENRNYCTYDGDSEHSLVPYWLSGYVDDFLLRMEDQDGFLLECADWSSYEDGTYSFRHVPFGAKVKVCMPFVTEPYCTGVTLKIQGRKIVSVTFNRNAVGRVQSQEE